MNCCLQDDVRSSRNDILAQIGLLKDEVLQMRRSSMPRSVTNIQDHLQPIRDIGGYQEDSGHDRKDTVGEGGEEVRAKGGYTAEEGRKDVIEKEQLPPLPKYKVGWLCKECTFCNTPYRPGCEMCGSTRPNSYIPPPDIIPTVDERMILEKDKEAEEQIVQVRKYISYFEKMKLSLLSIYLSWQFLELEHQQEQLEAEENYLRLLKTDKLSVVTNEEMFKCPICLTDIDPGDGIRLRGCLHTICM